MQIVEAEVKTNQQSKSKKKATNRTAEVCWWLPAVDGNLVTATAML